MKKLLNRILTAFTVFYFITSCRNGKENIIADGFYRKFSFKDGKGEMILDTMIKKGKNNIDQAYCFVQTLNDSIKMISFFSNLKEGPYYDLNNVSIIYAFEKGEVTVYEGGYYSYASGPAKQYYLSSGNVYSRFILYPYLLSAPSKDNRTLLLEYDEKADSGPTRKTKLMYIRPSDTVNLRLLLMEPDKLKQLILTARKDD